MKKLKKNPKNEAESPSPFEPDNGGFILLVFFLASPFVIYFWSSLSPEKVIKSLSLSYLAFLLGTIFEFLRISGSFSIVFKTLLGSLGGSLLNFLPYKSEKEYSFERHLNNWPLVFTILFVFGMIVLYSKKFTAKLGEGITLLHSITILYLLFEFMRAGWGSFIWILLCFVPVSFSLGHALSKIEITTKDRLFLSLWSSFAMFIFACVYVYNILHLEKIERLISEARFNDGAITFFEYFLIGASGPYILQNVIMLFGYFPSKHRFFNKEYFEDIKELNKTHIERYSAEQVDRLEALLVLIFNGSLLAANFKAKWVSPSFAVWFSLIISPILVGYLRMILVPIFGISTSNSEEGPNSQDKETSNKVG